MNRAGCPMTRSSESILSATATREQGSFLLRYPPVVAQEPLQQRCGTLFARNTHFREQQPRPCHWIDSLDQLLGFLAPMQSEPPRVFRRHVRGTDCFFRVELRASDGLYEDPANNDKSKGTIDHWGRVGGLAWTRRYVVGNNRPGEEREGAMERRLGGLR